MTFPDEYEALKILKVENYWSEKKIDSVEEDETSEESVNSEEAINSEEEKDILVVEIEGKNYFKNKDNILYDNTLTIIGRWNEEEKKIDIET